MTYVGTSYPKVDATADLYVNVTAADIRAGTVRDHCNCAVAQAIKRSVGRPDAAAVIFPSVAYVLMPCDRATARARFNEGVRAGELAWHRFILPPVLRRAVVEFDETGNTEPLGYQFREPSPSERLSYRRQHVPRSEWISHRSTHRNPWLREKRWRLQDEEPGEGPENVVPLRRVA